MRLCWTIEFLRTVEPSLASSFSVGAVWPTTISERERERGRESDGEGEGGGGEGEGGHFRENSRDDILIFIFPCNIFISPFMHCNIKELCF